MATCYHVLVAKLECIFTILLAYTTPPTTPNRARTLTHTYIPTHTHTHTLSMNPNFL